MQPTCALGTLLLLASQNTPTAADWPQFRGPESNGVVTARDLAEQWSEEQNLAWKVKLPGAGWSQPVVVGSRVYVTAAVGQGLERPMGMQAGVADPRTMKAGQAPDVEIDWRVLAYELGSGKELWSVSAAKAKPKFPIHPSNTYATETPAADDQGVYAYFGATGTVAAYDPAGKARWKVELGAFPILQGYGTASSPAIYAGKLYVQSFNDEQAFLVCLETATGKELWRNKREQAGTSWSSPLVWHNQERTEIVVSGNRLITSYDPASGSELWRINGVEGPSSCSFAADLERIYFGQRSPMANPPLYALTAGGKGDLSPSANSIDIQQQAWLQRGASPGMPSPVACDSLLYIANENLLTCRDALSGEEIYKERVPGLVMIAASPIVIGDKLLLLDEEGQAAWVPVGPEFSASAAGKLNDIFWATPAVAGSRLLVRGVDHLYCIAREGAQ